MAIRTGWVGTDAKAETGKAWMGEARLELNLSKAGWMSEMIGKSTEVAFINTVDRTQANIHTLMGSPTAVGAYVFENIATISAASRGGWALQTGTFPAGSTLKIINRGHIRGGGGNGGGDRALGAAGGSALVLNFPTTVDNTAGTIWGGGGGGGGAPLGGGGGGGGIPAGAGGTAPIAGGAGGEVNGGAGGYVGSAVRGGAGGSVGNAGGNGTGQNAKAGGRGGYSVQTNGNAVSWIAVGDSRGAVV